MRLLISEGHSRESTECIKTRGRKTRERNVVIMQQWSGRTHILGVMKIKKWTDSRGILEKELAELGG